MIKYQGISTLEVLKEAKNYNKWIADEVLKHLTTPALEVGAGTGNLTSYLLKKKPLYISDMDSGLVAHLKKRFEGEKNTFIKNLDVSRYVPQELKNVFATVYGINVLEHIEDDEKALKNIHSLLKKDGKLVLLVPAKKYAYTKLDKELGHFRRYEKNELYEKLQKTGYRIEKIYFLNIVGLASWYLRDKVKRKDINIKPYHITIFDKIVPFLRKIESFISVPVGISLIVVAQKTE